jgi:phosphoribosylaminoimidazole-succinocarboxamide synthase
VKSPLTFSNQVNFYKGKVRDVYTIGDDTLVAVASDRISSFDVILPKPIPYKGQVLNQIAAHFLEATADIVPNWRSSTPYPTVSMGKKCDPIPIEVVVRDALVGHAWRTYKAGGRELCGVQMPEGMAEYDRFDGPIITPATKAQEGHDEDTSYDEILNKDIVTKEELDEIYEMALKLFVRGQEMAQEWGLYLCDTKYEFGKDADGAIILIDEVHTPDSSRYFHLESYNAFLTDRTGEEPKHLSKEFVRQWLIENDFMGKEGQTMPQMPDEFVEQISQRYIDLYETITGKTFKKIDYKTMQADVVTAVESELAQNE